MADGMAETIRSMVHEACFIAGHEKRLALIDAVTESVEKLEADIALARMQVQVLAEGASFYCGECFLDPLKCGSTADPYDEKAGHIECARTRLAWSAQKASEQLAAEKETTSDSTADA